MKTLIQRCARVAALFCVSLPCFALAPAPNSQFVAKVAEDGAAVGAVNAIFQDHEGYIWLGGTDGLARYDGYQFEVFRNNGADRTSISSNAVWSIAEDAGGALWIATDAGLNRFDRDKKRFARFGQQAGRQGGLVSDTVRSLARDRSGVLWIGTYGGLARLNPDRASFTSYPDPSARLVKTLLADAQGTLWLGTEGSGLNRFDPATRAFTRYGNVAGNPASLSHNVVTSIAEDRDHRLWVGTGGGGLNLFDPRSGAVVRYVHDERRPDSLLDNNVSTVLVDRDGALWVGTPLGVDVLQPGARGFVHLRADRNNQRGLASANVRSIFQDNNGDVWVGTFPNGINFLNAGTLAFRSYGKAPDGSGLSHDSVLSAHQDPAGNLWFGTDGGGLDRLDAVSGRMAYYAHDPKRADSLSANVVLSIAGDRDGALWLGTWEGGLDRFDPRSGKAGAYFVDYGVPTTISSNNTWTVLRDSADTLWIGTTGAGLDRYDRQANGFTHYLPQPGDPASIGSPVVWALHEDRQRRLWLGTGDGLDLLDRASGKFTHYRHRDGDPASVSAAMVLAVHEDAQGALWLGTRGGGLDRFDPARGRARRYGQKEGLPSEVVVSIQEDERGHLWLGTQNGLVEFDPATARARTFTGSDGIQGNEFNIGAALKLRSGELLFGGTRGYTRFFPGQVSANRYRPPVVFRDFQVFNKSALADAPGSPLHNAIEKTRDITLDYWQSVFTIEYAALGYRNPGKNRYAYRMVGFDREWNEVGARRSATYTNLDAGDYTFVVKASNDEGLWSDRPATLRIHVLPPPWQAWWAYTLYGMLGAGAAWAFVRSQRNKVRRQLEINHLLENKVAERTQQLAQKNADLERINRKLEDISLADPLTGLHNRRYLSKCIGADSALAIRAHQRRGGDEPALAQDERDLLFFIMDIDHFKSVNDTYGHANGDAVLVQVANILRQASREGDMVLRWGGEEFLIVSRFTDREQAGAIAERFRAAVESHVFVLDQGRTLRKTCSIGFACFPFKRDAPEEVSVEQVIDIADRCLYQVKRQQRNGWMGLCQADGVELAFAELAGEPQRQIDAGRLVLKTSIGGVVRWVDAAPH